MQKFLSILVAIVIIAGYASISPADIVNVNPSMTTDQINQAISASEPNDTIVFEDGSYNITFWDSFYDFLPNRDYLFGTATISGSGLEHESIIRILGGGNINIIADSLTLQKSKRGFWIGDRMDVLTYNNITITGINFNIYENGMSILNNKHSSPLTEAAVKVSNCYADGGRKFIMHSGGTVTENSPYSSVTNCTLLNVTSDGGCIDIPWYAIEDEEGNVTWFALGMDDIQDNTLINCTGLSNPFDYWRYSSPSNLGQKDVDEPLITGAIYYDQFGNPHTFGGENCFIADPNDFLPDGITPRRDGRLNLGEGNYIGSIEPYHELPGNLNFDEMVDILDLAVAASRFDGDLTEVLLVASDWLTEEPTDPLGNPK